MNSLTRDSVILTVAPLAVVCTVGTIFLASAQPLPTLDPEICARWPRTEPQAAAKYDDLRLRAIVAQRAACCCAYATKARSATTHSTASRRSSTGPNSMPLRPERFSR